MARQHCGLRKAKGVRALILLLTFCLLFFASAQASEETPTIRTSGTYEYSILSDDTVCIDLYFGDAGVVFIPSRIDGRNVTKIGKYAFQGCGAKRIHTPETLIEIEEGAFQNCKQLECLQLNDGLERIGKFAFRGCEIMKTITLPASLYEVDGSAFILCSALSAIHVEAGSQWFRENGGWLYTKDLTCLVSIPSAPSAGRMVAFRLYAIEEIGDYACYRHLDLRNFHVDGSAIKRIGDYAFAGCTELELGQLNDELEEIGSYAFAACPKLLEMTIPASVVRLGENIFFADDYMMLNLTLDSAAENYARENGVMYSIEPEW